jgi:hypothetical protein
MHLSEVGYISESHSECTVLSVARDVGNGLRGEVSEVTFATYGVLRIGLPLLAQCSTLLAQIHGDFAYPVYEESL